MCSLVENKQFQVSGIKISQLIRIYGLYLLKTRQAPADTLAEFFYMTAGLLLEKTKSLLPGAQKNIETEEIFSDEKKFMKSLERYKPYREAYHWLNGKLSLHSKSFRRENPEPREIIEREIIIDSDGVYILAKTWRNLYEKHQQNLYLKRAFSEAESKADWDGFSGNDQKQIEARISELEEQLKVNKFLSFNDLCKSKNSLVITLLALLELCRMGKAYIEQKELFSDVRIIPKN